MVLVLVIAGNLLWTAIYIMIIRAGLRDRTYGMPIVALGGNIAWEGIYAFVRPYDEALAAIALVWFLLDCLILYTVVRFGPSQFPWLSKPLFLCSLTAVMALCWAGMDALIRQFELRSEENGSVYTGLAQSLVIAALFLAMLAHRRSTAGQSLAIASCKLLADIATVVAICLWVDDGTVTEEPVLHFMLIALPVLSAAYLVALFAVGRSPARGGVPGSLAIRRQLEGETP